MVDRKLVIAILLYNFYKNKNRKKRTTRYLKLLKASSRNRWHSLLILTSTIAAMVRQHGNVDTIRRTWMLPRPQYWFNAMLNDPVYNHNPYWRQQFRVSRETFNFLVALLRQSIEKRNTQLRDAISIEKRVAVALWRLATGNCFRAVASTFGIGKSSAMKVTNEVIESLVDLKEDWIKFPRTEQDTAEAIDRFSTLTNSPLPQVAGAIDGSHIPIKGPQENKESYFNRKRFYSMNLQGIVGGDGRFLDVAVGFPGSIHDARVMRMSGIYARIQSGEVLQQPIENINNVPIGPLIIGDSAYPSLPWLLKPYSSRNINHSKARFNTILSKSRVIVEQTFGALKGRWRCLLKVLEIHPMNVPKTVVACCVLHNICVLKGEPELELDESEDDDDDENGDDLDSNADDIREAIRSYLDGI